MSRVSRVRPPALQPSDRSRIRSTELQEEPLEFVRIESAGTEFAGTEFTGTDFASTELDRLVAGLGRDGTVPHAGDHEPVPNPVECGLARRQLRDDVTAVLALLDHSLHPADLALEPT